MHTRLSYFLLLGIVLLALGGAAEAAIASSGGELSSSIAGNGMINSAKGISA
jgi:hypothetical protein